MRPCQRFWNDANGVTALEYGLIAAVAASLIAVAFRAYGARLAAAFAGITV